MQSSVAGSPLSPIHNRDNDDPKNSVSPTPHPLPIHPTPSTLCCSETHTLPSPARRDSRIPTLIRNGLQEKKRSFFVVVGDRSKDAIVHLYYIMSSMDVRQNKSVLWAYKNKLLGFTSHRKKRENKIKKEIKRGTREANSEDPFELFISLHDIRYVYYKETDKILGNTYGMVSGHGWWRRGGWKG